jgi:MYXO-CTERM domain-containing protein
MTVRSSRRRSLVLGSVVLVAVGAMPRLAQAATYEVGPGKAFKEISEVTARLLPGDVVEVQGNATYKPIELAQNGTAAAPITLRGVRVNGKRPVVTGGENTVLITGNYTVLEGFEITGGSQICVVHRSHGNVFRDDVVHGCARHGILGTDSDSGSLTMEYVEVYDAGSERAGEALKHPVYIATDEKVHPGSVFRMQHCYVHDANGGNSVKSRAERNEIYSNWLEGGQYYELELIGPDDDSGDRVTAPREDGDVVGNVFFQTKSVSYVVRIGGDGTGRTGGRYRFVNNTFVHANNEGNFGSVRLSYALESVEFYNNVFYSPIRPITYLMRETELTWVSGQRIAGSNNWISQGAQNIPTAFANSILGKDPGFTDLAKRDVRPVVGSPLIDKGTATTNRPDAYAIPRPLAKAAFTPPLRVLAAPGKASARLDVGAIDIGAFEFGSPTEEPGIPGTEPPVVPGNPGLPLPGSPPGPDADGGGSGAAAAGDGGCSCGASGGAGVLGLAAPVGLAALGLALARRRRRRV